MVEMARNVSKSEEALRQLQTYRERDDDVMNSDVRQIITNFDELPATKQETFALLFNNINQMKLVEGMQFSKQNQQLLREFRATIEKLEHLEQLHQVKQL